MYYANLLGTLICRPRVVCLGGGCSGRDPGTLSSTSPSVQCRFVDIGAADREVVGIALLACSANFLVVAASFSCCFCARFLLRPKAFASHSSFFFPAARFWSSFACAAFCFSHNLDAFLSSFVLFSGVFPALLHALVPLCICKLLGSQRDPRTLPCYKIPFAVAGLEAYSSS
jgi:hypothetical protein